MLLNGKDGDVVMSLADRVELLYGRDSEVMSLGDRVELLYGRDGEVMSLGNKSYCCCLEGTVMSL